MEDIEIGTRNRVAMSHIKKTVHRISDLHAMPLLLDEDALAHYPRYPVVHLVVGAVPLLKR